MTTKLIHTGAAVADFDTIRNSDRIANAAKIVSGTARSSRSSQTVDLHDVTGHHRYYGSSAAA